MPGFSDIISYAHQNSVSRLVRRSMSYAAAPASRILFERYIRANFENIVVGYEELKSKYADQVWELEEDLEGLHRNLNQELAPLSDRRSVSYDYSPHFSFKHPFVAEVSNITVAGLDSLAITSDGRVLAEPIHSLGITPDGSVLGEPTHSISGPYVCRVGERTVSSMVRSPVGIGRGLLRGTQPSSTRRYETAALLNFHWYNYYHWMMEQFPKLRGIQEYEKSTGTDVRLIIPSNPPPYVTESLDLLGYDTEDYVEWDTKSTWVDSLVVPSFPEPTPYLLEWLREELMSSIGSIHTDNTGFVYISRQKSERRRVDNFDQIEPVLDKYDIDILHCQEMSLEEEIRVFSTASGIIGPHGAGLTAMLWGSDMKVLELFNEVVKGPYYLLAHVLGHDYAAFHGTSLKAGTEMREIDRDLVIDPWEFESKVDMLVQS